MTTTVKIEAHCAEDTQVRVIIYNQSPFTILEDYFIQDGETSEKYIYDTRDIHIREVKK